MGADKALIAVDGRSLVALVAERLATVCGEVLIAPGRRRLPDAPRVQIEDRLGGEGPLAGILGGLAAARTPLVAVAAVDMPEVSPPLFAELAAAWDGRRVAVVPSSDGHPQPLHAVYATSALPAMAALFDAGERSPTRALRRLDALVLEPTGDAGWARGLDTPEALARFRARYRR